jgi:hypothetical protein
MPAARLKGDRGADTAMRRRLIGLIVMVMATAWVASRPSPVWGQGKTWAGRSLARLLDTAYWRMNRLRINASFSLADAGYDSDIFYGYLDERFPDYTFSATLPIQALFPISKKVVLELDEAPQYLFYLKNERERAWNNVLSGRLHIALERLYVQAGGGLSDVRRRMTPELDINVRERAGALEGIVLWQGTRNVSFATLGEYTKYDYGELSLGQANVSQNLDRVETFADLVTYIQPGAHVRFFIDGQYGRYAFSELINRLRNADSYAAFGGLTFLPPEGAAPPAQPFQGSICVGYKVFDILNPAYPNGSGFVGLIDVSANVFKRTVARAYVSRDYAFSVFSDATFYLSNALSGGLSYQLTPALTLSYDIAFTRGTYPQSLPLGSASNYDFDVFSHTINLSIRFARYLEVTLQAMLGRRTVANLNEARTRNFFGLTLVYGIPAGAVDVPARGLLR